MNLELSTSFFADIQRLPPAHGLKLSATGSSVSRYWSLPTEQQLRYQRRQDYVDHFQQVMHAAVADRMQTDSVAILLSGGMDSSSVAATAHAATRKSGTCKLKAFTYVYDRLMPDRERYYSGLVASALDLPISYTASDDYQLFRWPSQTAYRPFELIHEPLRALFCDFTQSISQHSRVALTGDGGDALLYPEDNFPRKVLSSLAFGRLISDVAFSYRSYGRFPRMGFRSGLKNLGTAPNEAHESYLYPGWLDHNFEERCRLKNRWQEQEQGSATDNFVRRRSYESLASVMWPVLFADYDPEVTGSPVEFRYPFFDIRVVNFLLTIPSSPWCFNKGLLRIATQGQLPEEIRKRLKTQIVEDPIFVRVRQSDWELTDYLRPVERLQDYVNVSHVNKSDWLLRPDQIWMHTRPLSLNYWLRSL
jgi:asparagine synthase (glutamine-hydrolysing)